MKKLNFMKKISIVLAFLGVFGFSMNSNAQLNNQDFETGDLTGWTTGGYAYASAGETYLNWVVTPSGTYMSNTSASGLSMGDAESNLGLPPGALTTYNPGVFDVGSITDFSTLTQDVFLNMGETVTIYWNYVSIDYAPFNDGCIASFTGPSSQEIHILAITVDAFGDPEAIVVGTYGSSGWYDITFTAPATGTYRVGFSSFNMLDTALDPWLFNDGEPGGTSAPGEPVVTTDPVTNVAIPNATSGGSVSDNGGTPGITERGICWNTTGSPTIADEFTVDGSGFGSFTSTLTGLINGQTYYVRAYATNSQGTFYGGQVSFTTGVLPGTPVSNWALILGGIAIAVFVVMKMRKTI
jgi:hypothetical protein